MCGPHSIRPLLSLLCEFECVWVMGSWCGCVHVRVHVRVCVRACVCLCMYICMYVCMYMYVSRYFQISHIKFCVLYVYIYTGIQNLKVSKIAGTYHKLCTCIHLVLNMQNTWKPWWFIGWCWFICRWATSLPHEEYTGMHYMARYGCYVCMAAKGIGID